MFMDDEEMKRTKQDLMQQIQEKALQLSDLEIILGDYERERQALLREIGRLKASLWEIGVDNVLPIPSCKNPKSVPHAP
jgi:hypothetical protein